MSKTIKPLLLFISIILFTAHASAFSFNKFFNNVFHQEKNPHAKINGPVDHATHVKVGIDVLHVGKYDLQSASTPLDFYLIFHCSPLCNHMDFEIMNATSSTINLVAKPAGSLIYRVQANLTKNDSLRNFPFDSHSIDIILEEKALTRDKLVFAVDPATTALDSNLSVIGYQLMPKWYANVTDHFYSVLNRTYSSYKFSMLITRPWLAGILKGILPALIIMCCSFLALLFKIEYSSQRVSISTSTLITIAVFHLTLTSSLPPLGYITYIDLFMLINYLCLFSILIEVVLTAYFIKTPHHDITEKINLRCAWLIPLTWLTLQVIAWIFFDPTNIIVNGF